MRHTLSDIDAGKRTATCAVCGPGTRIWKGGVRREGKWQSGRWRCSGRVKAQPSRGRYLDPNAEREAKWRGRGIKDFTVEDYDRLLEEQDGRCALCESEMKRAVVDHDHDTGKVRGLLCDTCNTGLGKFGDNAERLEAAAEYVRRRS